MTRRQRLQTGSKAFSSLCPFFLSPTRPISPHHLFLGVRVEVVGSGALSGGFEGTAEENIAILWLLDTGRERSYFKHLEQRKGCGGDGDGSGSVEVTGVWG